MSVREGVILLGPAGAGEFSPFARYDPRQSRPWLDAALEAATTQPPPAKRTNIQVNASVPAVGPEVAAGIVRQSGGCRTVKVKVAEPGDTLSAERDRLAAVRDALGAAGAIRIDANGEWDAATAVERIAQLDRAAGGLEYAEQPCRTVAELAEVRRRSAVPIAADESIRLSADPLAVVRQDAADIAVLKVQPLGGVRACLELAERLGLPVVVSSALETSIGLAAGLALAAALPDLPFACGLATAQLLATDATSHPLRPVDGQIRLALPPPDRLQEVAADAATTSAWQARLAQVVTLDAGGSAWSDATRRAEGAPRAATGPADPAGRRCSARGEVPDAALGAGPEDVDRATATADPAGRAAADAATTSAWQARLAQVVTLDAGGSAWSDAARRAEGAPCAATGPADPASRVAAGGTTEPGGVG
jgi:O-succinylbenzoate synthase